MQSQEPFRVHFLGKKTPLYLNLPPKNHPYKARPVTITSECAVLTVCWLYHFGGVS